MEQLAQDIRFAVRRLRRRPLFTLVALASLTIGIGANTAIFTLVNAVIFRDAVLERPEELVNVYKALSGFSHAPMSYPDLEDVRRETGEVFAEVGGSRLGFVQTDVDGAVEMLGANLVTGNFFPMLGVRARIGRTLLPTDDQSPGGHYVAMLAHSYWESRYGSDPGVIGRDIRLNGRGYEIVGVAPASYTGDIRGFKTDVYAPIMMVGHLISSEADELEARGNHSTFVKARLAPGVSVPSAEGTLNRLAAGLRREHPRDWQGSNEFVVVPTAEVIMNPMVDRVLVPAAGMLVAVVALVLLIACANLASFLLAQAADRRREIALRLALGAPRRRLVGQLLTESLALALVGGASGVVLAVWLLGILQAADLPLPFPVSLELRLDSTVLLYSLAVTAGAGLFFGLAPALQATRPDVAPTIKDESTGGGAPARLTLRGLLVGGQVAVSLILLLGAGLFLRSLQARTAVDPGFGYDNAGLLSVQLPSDTHDASDREVFFRQLVDEASLLPEVISVGMMQDLHLSALNNMMMDILVDGVEPPPGEDFHLVDWSPVDRGLFAALGIPIVEGREFLPTDEPGTPPVAVVSEAMARQFWGSPAAAVGRSFREEGREFTVVGVAADAKVRSLGELPRPFIYRSFDQTPSTFMTVVAATRGDAQRTAGDLLSLVRAIEPDVIVYESKTMERHLAVMLLPQRMAAMLVGAFGVLALLLACIGLYGAVSYAVSTRTREVGIRMSLGAERGEIVRMLMGSGVRMIVAGGVVGLGLALIGARLLEGLLYGIGAFDPVAFVLVPVVLGLVGVLATWLPARRVAVVSPVRALKGK